MRSAIILLLLFPAPALLGAQEPRGIGGSDFRPHFQAFDARGCFVGFDEPEDRWIRHGGELCGWGHLPASTFKILNSLIVLETGVVEDENEVIEWDGVDRGWSEWNRSHDLESAFRYSAVWVYQELARRVGPERMAAWVEKADYGNGDIGGGVDRFWLDGRLRISPTDQVRFLRRLARNDLPFSPEVMQTVREIMVDEEGHDWILRGKTGWARPEGGNEVGWKVGWVQAPEGRFFFATLIVPPPGPEGFPMRRAQTEITRGILAELGVLPQP